MAGFRKDHGYEIILRALEPEDIEVLYRWENDPEIWRVSNAHAPYSRYILEKYIESSHLDIYEAKQLRLMIDVKENGNMKPRPVGTIDLFDFDPYHNRAGIGILIGEKTDRRKGFANLALKLFIEYGFKTLQLHQLFCNITADNKSSLNLFRKNGFSITGKKKDWIKTPGGYVEEYLLQLINPDDQRLSSNMQ
jgi:diamine N-acetyltransferase